MHKFRATYLGAFILGWLLAFGVAPGAAYYSPLPATATYTSNTVSRSVYDPKLQKQWDFVTFYGGDNVGVVDLKQQNGVIAWVLQIGNTYQVTCSVYDPGAGTFKEDTQWPFTDVSQLQIVDGVVTFVAGMPPTMSDPAHPEFKYATYDPAKGAWQKRSYVPYYGIADNVSNLTVGTIHGGVVLFSFNWAIHGTTSFEYRVDIYDSAIGKWFSEAGAGVPEILFGDSYLTCQIFMAVNATIYISIYHPVLGFMYNDALGYDPSLHQWYHGPSKPMAYFVAQPDFGKKPLWVWFTDMSIAGYNWSWDFGDSTPSSTSRSPSHTFASTGNFQVTQQIYGPSTCSRTITVLTTFILDEGKSLPAMLHLLLLTD
jgi:hypothetical protein